MFKGKIKSITPAAVLSYAAMAFTYLLPSECRPRQGLESYER